MVLQTRPKGGLGLIGLWDLKYENPINIGQFVLSKFGAEVLLITDLKLYSLTGDRAIEIEGYRPTTSFTSAVMVQDKYLTIAQGSNGIAFYEYLGPKQGLKYLTTIGSSNFNRPNFHVEDIAYNGKDILFILDRNFGMLMAKIKI